jgi:hypothetical protein
MTQTKHTNQIFILILHHKKSYHKLLMDRRLKADLVNFQVSKYQCSLRLIQ